MVCEKYFLFTSCAFAIFFSLMYLYSRIRRSPYKNYFCPNLFLSRGVLDSGNNSNCGQASALVYLDLRVNLSTLLGVQCMWKIGEKGRRVVDMGVSARVCADIYGPL